MNVFLDSSALFKLYHEEEGSDEMLSLFQENEIEGVFLAEITIIEFISAVSKKTRTEELTLAQAELLISSFEKDLDKYTFSPQTESIVRSSVTLIKNIAKRGYVH